jgi:hypothetical protein
MDDVKMFLFARWISTCYADTHIDKEKRKLYDIGYDSSTSLSVLTMEDGHWYKKQIQHFNEVVYPNYIKNGSVKDAKQFFGITTIHQIDKNTTDKI